MSIDFEKEVFMCPTCGKEYDTKEKAQSCVEPELILCDGDCCFCDCYDDEREGCTMPSVHKLYACPCK